MTAADLSGVQARMGRTDFTTYRGWTVYELPPNTQGIAALLMLNLMEQFPLGEYGFHSAEALHVMIEAKKLAYADMLQYVGDPRFATTPVPAMLNKAHARKRARLIDPARAACKHRAVGVRRPHQLAPAATPSTSPPSTRTAPSCR